VALTHVQSVSQPSTLNEAWNEKASRGAAARFLGGGIDVVLFTPPSVDTLIDLSGLDLSGIADEDAGIEIGAMATMTDVMRSPLIGAYAGGFLERTLRQVASPLQRNLGTLGGTIASAHPWSDVIPALQVLDAELRLYAGESRSVSINEYLGDRAACCEAIIEAVILPSASKDRVSVYRFFTRTAFDISLLNVAVSARIEAGSWKDVRVSIGGRPGLAARQPAIEVQLEGAKPDDLDIDAVARSAADQVELRDDVRATADYRRELVAVLLKECLAELGGGGDGE